GVTMLRLERACAAGVESRKRQPLIASAEASTMPSKFLPYWMTPAIVKAAGVMACILFIVSYAVDLTLLSFEVAPSSTVLNDIAIALIATGVMLFYLFSTHTQHVFLRAKERMNLTAELNHNLPQYDSIHK